MAPKVRVPADFGKHHIGSPAHSNLILKLKDGGDVKANSMILSFNSPVIDELTTNLHQTYLDMDDFEVGAVERFVESMYTGELERVDQENFRDINKLSRVFDVSWLVDRCEGYFKELVRNVTGNEYNEMLYIVEEAKFLMSTLKNLNFLTLVTRKMDTIKNERNSFIERYIMSDFNNSSKDQMNLVIKLMGNDVHVLINFLTKHLVAHKECLHYNSRYLLENMDMLVCFRKDKTGYQSLMNALEDIDNISKEDFKMLLKINQQLTDKSGPSSSRIQPTSSALAVSTKIPNLFTTFEYIQDLSFEDLIKELSVSTDVCNLYMFFEAVWLWLNENNGRLVNCDNSELREEIEAMKRNRGWAKISSNYLDVFKSDTDTNSLINLMRQSNDLVCNADYNCRILYSSWYNLNSIKSIIEKGTNLTFWFYENDGFLNCPQDGCGIILKVTPATKNNFELFDINLCTNPDEYLPDMHFHQDLTSADDMHIVIERGGSSSIYPLSWCGKPRLDTTGTHWGWGIHGLCVKQTTGIKWTGTRLSGTRWKRHVYDEYNYPFRFVLLVMK